MIIFDARRMMAYEKLKQLGTLAGKTDDYLEELWGEFITDAELLGAFAYYVDNHSLYDGIECRGYGLTDLYFYNMRRTEMRQDIGKNYADSNKEAMALDTFFLMAQMMKDPQKYIRHLEGGPGADRLS